MLGRRHALTLSTLISKSCRLTSRLVDDAEIGDVGLVVQRWNQAVCRLVQAARLKSPPATDRSLRVGPRHHAESTRNSAIIQPMIAGRKNTSARWSEYSTFSPGCRMSSIYRPYAALN